MDKFDFDRVANKLAQTKRVLPIKLAKQAENHFTESFSKSRLDDKVWKKSQRQIEGTYSYEHRPKSLAGSVSLNAYRRNPTLVLTGNLRRKVSRSIHDVDWDNIRLVVDLPYAEIHNTGSQTMPARPYMVQTPKLSIMQQDLIEKEMNKIWQ